MSTQVSVGGNEESRRLGEGANENLRSKMRTRCDFCVETKHKCEGGQPCKWCKQNKKDCEFSPMRKSGPSASASTHKTAEDYKKSPQELKAEATAYAQRLKDWNATNLINQGNNHAADPTDYSGTHVTPSQFFAQHGDILQQPVTSPYNVRSTNTSLSYSTTPQYLQISGALQNLSLPTPQLDNQEEPEQPHSSGRKKQQRQHRINNPSLSKARRTFMHNLGHQIQHHLGLVQESEASPFD